jgi:murein DD-endopeptidase MepM/ murein hydrolase activator NlpD
LFGKYTINIGAMVDRTSIHLIIILLIISAIGLSKIPWWQAGTGESYSLSVPAEAIAPATTKVDAPLTLSSELAASQEAIVRAAVPHTIVPDRSNNGADTREEVLTYIVETGDTVSGIAAKFGLTPETVTWANQALEKNPDLLQVGQRLLILPVDGVYHQVTNDDTIESIATTYKTDLTAIIDYPLNALASDSLLLQPDQWLIVPGGNKPYVPRTVTAYSGSVPQDAAVGTGIFVWPVSGTVTQGPWSGHMALDIAGWLGAPVLAADSGHIVLAGWDDTGYGNVVVVDHGNGFQTLYAHLQGFNVETGVDVSKGQQIATMGSTGNSTGTHTHFEIRQGTVQRNPLGFLP